ncbi:MAG: MFS transporter [Candidatus Thermoplasmatota archaeon]|nr:MFS transporter [Candidatus Thermoplasmatota archaeon]
MIERVKSYLNKLTLFNTNARMLLSSTILYSFGYGVYRVLFNLYILELGFSGSFLGNLLAVNFAAAGISSIPAGKVCDAIGRKNSMLISTVAITLSMLVLVTVEVKIILLAVNMIRGSANAMRRISRYPFMMEQSEEEERMHLFSTAASFRMFAGVGGRALAGILPALFLYYGGVRFPAMQNRLAMLLTVLFIAISIFPLLKIREERSYTGKEHLKSLKNWIKLKNPGLVKKLLVNSVLIGFGAGLIVQYFNVFFDQFIGMSRFQIGVLMAVGRSSMGVSVFLLPILVSRIGKVRSVIVTQLLSVPFLALMTVLRSPIGIGAAYVMRTSLMNMNHPAFNNFMMEVTHESERGTVSGWNYFARRLSRGGGVLGGGYAIERKAFIFPFYITMICYVTGSILYYYFFRKAKEGMKKAKWIKG